MISWLSYQKKPEQISSVVYSLANFYKLSLNKGKYIVPISDEISHVTYYMKKMCIRDSHIPVHSRHLPVCFHLQHLYFPPPADCLPAPQFHFPAHSPQELSLVHI